MSVSSRAVWRLIGTAAVVTVAWHAVLFAAAELLPPLSPGWFPDLGPTLVNLVALGVPLAIVVRRRWWRSAALAWRRPDRRWLLLLPALLPLVPDVVTGVTGTAAALASSAVLFAVLGVSEEALSRGVVQRLLTPLGSVRGAVTVGALFGLGHALSGAWFGRDPLDTAAQVVTAAAFGFAFAALRWHLGTIWPLAAVHGLDDWLQVNSPGRLPDVLQVAIVVFHVGFGVVLLRLLRTGRSRNG